MEEVINLDVQLKWKTDGIKTAASEKKEVFTVGVYVHLTEREMSYLHLYLLYYQEVKLLIRSELQ